MIQDHYCISVASNPPKGATPGVTTYKVREEDGESKQEEEQTDVMFASIGFLSCENREQPN